MCIWEYFDNDTQIICFKLKPVPNSCVMLSYKYLKLLCFGSKRNLSLLSSCKQERLLYPLKAVRVANDRARQLHKCGSSKSNGKSWKKIHEVAQKKYYQKNANHENAGTSMSNNLRKLSTEKTVESQEQNEAVKNKYQEYDTHKQEMYRLESAKPRKDPSRLVLNIFKSRITKEIDLNEHLQPNKLKPYGAQDNKYMPILMSNKNSCLIYTNPSFLPPDRSSLSKNNIKPKNDEMEDLD